MTKFLAIISLSLILIACGQKTQSVDKDKERLDNACDSFMQLFTAGKVHDAMRLLKRNTVMASATIDTLQATIDRQMNSFFPAYGKMLSYEFILERKVSNFIGKRFYILRFEKYFLKFDFTLYKTSDGWAVTNFKYDEELAEVLLNQPL